MDTLVMAVRSALLIMVTSAFAVLWSVDRPEESRLVDTPAAHPSDPRGNHAPNRVHFYEPSPEDVDADTTLTFPLHRLNAPLPEEIVSGVYLVVDRFGRTERRTINIATEVRGLPIRNHYTIESGGARWHFIRLDAIRYGQTAELPTSDTEVQ